MIQLLIVESQPGVRQGLHMRLTAEADLAVIGEATDSHMALALTRSLRPDVVLMDVDIPHMDGIATTRLLHSNCPFTPVIILSLYDDTRMRLLAEHAGAAAFVAKSSPADSLLSVIRQVSRAGGAGESRMEV